MTFVRSSQETRLEKRQVRSKQAKKWARVANISLIALGLTAIWQERALYPMVHDRMQGAYALGKVWLEKAEGSGGYLTAMGDFGSIGGNKGEHNAITRALLDLRQ